MDTQNRSPSRPTTKSKQPTFNRKRACLSLFCSLRDTALHDTSGVTREGVGFKLGLPLASTEPENVDVNILYNLIRNFTLAFLPLYSGVPKLALLKQMNGCRGPEVGCN